MTRTGIAALADNRMWGFVSVGASSALILVLTAVAARGGGADSLGEFAACLSAYAVGAAVSRALVPDVAIVTARAGDPRRQLRAREGATMIVVGATLPLMLLVIALQAQTPVWTTVMFALLMTGPVLQDSVRFLLIAQDRYRVAAATDVIALLVLSALLVIPLLAGRPTPLALVVSVWSAVTIGVAATVLLQSREFPSMRGGVNFLARNRRLGAGFLTDSGLAMVGSQTVLTLISAFAGVPALGAWRGAQSAMGPFGTVFQAIQPLAIRHASVGGATRGALRWLALVSAVLGAIAVLLAHLLTTLLGPLGEAVFSRAWGDVQPVVVPVALYLVGSWLTLTPVVFFRSTQRAGGLAALRAGTVAVQIATAAVAFTSMEDFTHACYVIAGAQLCLAATWWVAMYFASVSTVGGDHV